ncbi:MAG: NADH-quinone oxidoreductase subunit L, partial [Hymenobacteraceae bacterium]|nr:NADH-quinone oxidoreductase subunit L [Hymenobacteraceae bacterium]
MQEIVMPINKPEMALLCLLVPILPLLGFILNGLGNRKLANGVVSLIGCSTVLASFLISVYLFLDFTANGSRAYVVDFYNWIS